MSNAKRSEILLKVIKPIYEQHLDMRDIIDSLLVYVCREENSLQKRYFLLSFAGFYYNDCYKKLRQQNFFCVKKTMHRNFRSSFKEKQNFKIYLDI